jgi:hypothetical protein
VTDNFGFNVAKAEGRKKWWQRLTLMPWKKFFGLLGMNTRFRWKKERQNMPSYSKGSRRLHSRVKEGEALGQFLTEKSFENCCQPKEEQ